MEGLHQRQGNGESFENAPTYRPVLLFVRVSRYLNLRVDTYSIIYRVTVGVNIGAMTIMLGGLGPSPFQEILPMLTLALHNIMACKVFRLLKLGLVQDTPSSLSQITSDVFVNISNTADTSDEDSTRGADSGRRLPDGGVV